MKKTILFVAFILFAVIGCSRVYDVQYDYDQEKDFAQLKSYGWLPTPEGADIDDITIARIQNAVNAELKERGYRLDMEAPDFLIDKCQDIDNT